MNKKIIKKIKLKDYFQACNTKKGSVSICQAIDIKCVFVHILTKSKKLEIFWFDNSNLFLYINNTTSEDLLLAGPYFTLDLTINSILNGLSN